MKPILVLGVGNKLLKDEGIGAHLVDALREQKLPPDVDVEDGGARGIDLLALVKGRRLVIIVDCARMGEKPGTVRTFESEEVIRKYARGFTVHGATLANTLKIGEHLGILPDVVIIGIEPKTVEIEIGLSDVAEEALKKTQKLIEEIIRERS